MGICWCSPSDNPTAVNHQTTNNTASSSTSNMPAPNLRIFRFTELRAATNGFSSAVLLGEGGFGKVFKGMLNENVRGKRRSKIPVAIKRLNPESFQGVEEWQSEINLLGALTHPHLVKLLGCCRENKELLLVYEFMQKGSLDNHLFGRGSLDWNLRHQIALQAAKGLVFLHTREKQVIYRDFKSSNILLDGTYTAKISDFGLAKFGPSPSKSHVTTSVMGTFGYAAPEYVSTSLRAIDTKRPNGQKILVDWVKPYLSRKKDIVRIIDPRLEGKYNSKAALKVAQLALRCIAHEPRQRPSMEEVVQTLEKIE